VVAALARARRAGGWLADFLGKPDFRRSPDVTPMAAAGTRPPLNFTTKLAYGFGSAATGSKTYLLAALLFYYTQIHDLSPIWVSAVLGAANIIDAFWDPSLGQVSDSTRSPWGRRHIYMYAAAVPTVFCFVMLWNPPDGLSQVQLFAYMAFFYVAVRLLISVYEVPASALAPELAPGYDERTTLISYSWFFRIFSQGACTMLAGFVFLRSWTDAAGQKHMGQFNGEGYGPYAIAVGVIMLSAMLTASFGTRKFIPFLREAPKRAFTFRAMFREVYGALSNRNFVAIAASGLIFGITTGMGAGLQIFISTYFWGLNMERIAVLGIATLAASVAAVVTAPFIAKRYGKKRACVTVFFISIFVTGAPIGLRLIGLMPPNGSNLLLLILALDRIVATGLGIMGFIIVSSMIADIVEEVELKTGRRSEGLLFSADTILQKVATGFAQGAIPGLMLAAVAFPRHARPETLDPTIPHNLVLIYLPLSVGLSICSTSCLFFYRISREKHQENLRRLADAAALAEIAEESDAAVADASAILSRPA
jgi:GPH family glycoside/pentoside/hexuronide:cation symporter